MHREVHRLAQLEEYTVDVRLREFRRVDLDAGRMEFVPFESAKGAELVGAIDAWSKDFRAACLGS